jgi:hypothetical protein
MNATDRSNLMTSVSCDLQLLRNAFRRGLIIVDDLDAKVATLRDQALAEPHADECACRADVEALRSLIDTMRSELATDRHTNGDSTLRWSAHSGHRRRPRRA